MTILPQRLQLRESPRHLRMVMAFVAFSFVAIFATAATMSTILSRFIVDQMIHRDSMVSSEFLNSIVRVENAASYFSGAAPQSASEDFEEFLIHVAHMPDVFRANIYSGDGTILWSSDPELQGEVFSDNDELHAALHGIVEPELNSVSPDDETEHVGFPPDVEQYVEYYIPITDAVGGTIVGVVEVYKSPGTLLAAIGRVRMLSWIDALIAGTALFGGLALVITYASRTLMRQEARVLETERLAVVGEMASAVAHGLRNPLASIRSCAELTLDDDIPETSRGTLGDIIDQVDRLEGWIRDFLNRSRRDAGGGSGGKSGAPIDQVVKSCIDAFRPQMNRRDIIVKVTGSDPAIAAARALELEQVLNSIISNGIEAMENGGVLEIGWERRDDRLAIRISDTGPGISPEMLGRVFTPFATGKSKGMGVGLSLGRRIAERLGGSLELANRTERGVEVTLSLPIAV